MQSGWQLARVIHTAARLRLFDRLAEAGTAGEVAREADLDPRGVEILLDALASTGLVLKEGGRYRNSPLAAEYLVEDSPHRTLWYLDHVERIYRTWAFLPETVRRGRPAPGVDALRREEGNRLDFIRAMHALALPKAGPILAECGVAGVERAVDVGGGPGTWLAELLRRAPGVEGLLVDLPEPLAIARDLLAAAGLGDRVRLVERDVTQGEEPYAQEADLAILSHVLHSLGPVECRAVLTRLRASLAPGGRLLLHEFMLDRDSTRPQLCALFAVNMLAATPAGRAWRKEDLRAWLDEAGFGPHRELKAARETRAWVVER